MRLARLIASLVRSTTENVGGLLVLCGAALCYHGVAGFSRPAADIVAGAMLMAVGLLPYRRNA